ncbi:hypothetical protein AAFF_G00338370 [Aldrovandia affinis]|uniref:Uncharacterized protein n=1 Tax=Aldrovandia affinis TaxID=143900 RepID=A0AAD7R8I0_9TELE|nr:hypothetical protein AAFF_G00338370 [Aldrovandia affinis]
MKKASSKKKAPWRNGEEALPAPLPVCPRHSGPRSGPDADPGASLYPRIRACAYQTDSRLSDSCLPHSPLCDDSIVRDVTFPDGLRIPRQFSDPLFWLCLLHSLCAQGTVDQGRVQTPIQAPRSTHASEPVPIKLIPGSQTAAFPTVPSQTTPSTMGCDSIQGCGLRWPGESLGSTVVHCFPGARVLDINKQVPSLLANDGNEFHRQSAPTSDPLFWLCLLHSLCAQGTVDQGRVQTPIQAPRSTHASEPVPIKLIPGSQTAAFPTVPPSGRGHIHHELDSSFSSCTSLDWASGVHSPLPNLFTDRNRRDLIEL